MMQRISLFMAMMAVMLWVAPRVKADDQTWGANGNSAWYTATNWAGGAFPGLQGAAATNNDTATFTSAFTGTTLGINMTTASLNLGAIVIDSNRTTATNLGNSGATAGVLRLYGATVNGTANTILSNAGTGLFTLQAAQNGTMGVVFGNTINVIRITNTGGITIGSNISEINSASGLTLQGGGTGTLTLSGTNTYTGATTISTGTIRFANTASLYNSTTASWTAANIRVASGATFAINVGGAGEFTTANVTTLLTNLGALGGAPGAGNGLQAGSRIAFDTTNAPANSLIFANLIADSTGAGGGAIGLTKLGASSLYLSNTNNSYSGGFTLVAGSIQTSSNSRVFGTGTLTLAGGTVDTSFPSAAGQTLTTTNANIWSGNFTVEGRVTSGTWNNNGGVTLSGGSRTVTQGGVPFTLNLGGVINDGGNNYGLTFSNLTTTLSGANTYGGGTSFTGTLRINNGGSGGTSSAVGTGTLTLASGTIDNTSGSSVTLSTNNVLALTANFTFTGTNSLNLGTGNITLTGTRTITVTNNRLTLGGNTAGGSQGYVKSGAGILTLTGANANTGNNTINAGVLEVGILANGGVLSSLGSQTNAAASLAFTAPAAALRYIGSANITTDRSFTLSSGAGGGATIESSGAGTLSFNNAVALAYGTAAQTRTLTLGGTNTGANTFGKVIADNTTGATSLVKNGAGTWILTGTNTYTGTTAVSVGNLLASSASALGTGGTRNVTVALGAGLSYAAAADAALPITGTFGITGGTGTTIGGSIGSTITSAQITVSGAATITDAAHIVNIYGIAGVAPVAGTNTYTLIAGGAGSSLNPATTPTFGRVFNNTNFTVGALSRTASVLQVEITSQTSLTAAFWTGGLSGSTNVWSVSDGTTSNWVTAAGGGVTGLIPGSGADVTISATTVATAPTATVLGASMSIRSLTIADTANGLGIANDGYTLTIANAAGITVNAGVPASTIATNVALGIAQTWTSNSANDLTVSGVVSGAFNLSKAGSGTIVLSGVNMNSGATSVNAGTLTLSGNRSAAVGGTFSVGSTGNTGVVLNISNGTYTFAANQFAVGNSATAGETGTVNQTGGAVSFTGGNQLIVGNAGGTGIYNLSAGTLTTVASALGVVLGVNTGTTGTFNLSGTGTLTMPATSTLQISRSDNSAANTATGTFNQSGGTAIVGILQIGGSNTAPANNANANSTLTLTGGTFTVTTFNVLSGANNSVSQINIGGTALVTLPAFPTARGTGATATINFDGGTLRNSTASATYLGGLTNAFIEDGGAQFDTVNGSITITQALLTHGSSLNGGLTKIGASTLTLSGANTYTGTTTVGAGTLQAGVDSVANVSGAFGNNSAVSLANVATAILNTTGFNTQIGSLTGGGTTGGNVTLGAASLTVGGNSTSPAAYAGIISGTGTLTKIGTGTLTLTGNNTYTGATLVNRGTLIVGVAGAGSLANTAVTVGGASASGTPTLGGSGTIAGPVIIASAGGGVAGTLAPGNSVGTITLGGGLALNPGATLALEITNNGTTGTIGGGESTVGLPTPTSNDFLNITGTTTINAGSNFAIDGGGLTFVTTSIYSYQIASGAGDQSALNISSTASPSQFSATNFANFGAFETSITGKATGEVYLNFAPIPEPAAGLLAIFGMLVCQFRKTRSAKPARA